MPSEARRDYLSPGEVARLLHVTPKTVARWADNGWLSCVVTLGGHRRFAREEIEAIGATLTRTGSLPSRARAPLLQEPADGAR